MDADRIVEEQIALWRKRPYSDLCGLINMAEHTDMPGVSGETWVRETQVVWDNKPGGNIRVIVDVFVPVKQGGVVGSLAYDDFILGPDGAFVGE